MTHDTTDLTNYYTGSQVDSKLNDYLSKTDAGNNYYNKSEVDKKLTAASQNNSSGIFINNVIINFPFNYSMQTYTTTEKCYATFSLSGTSASRDDAYVDINNYKIASAANISETYQKVVFGLYLNSGIKCSFLCTDATFFSLTN